MREEAKMRSGIIQFLTITGLILTGCENSEIKASYAETMNTQVTVSQTVYKTEYKGWKDAYRLSNGTVEVIVVPSVGRIMRYGFIGGPNILWENPAEAGKMIPSGRWTNTGGDKIWPWPQDDWGKILSYAWPPPVNADQAPHRAEIIGKDTLRLTSKVVAPWGIHIVRDIKLASTGTRVSFVNRFVKSIDTDPAPAVGVWTITQIPATEWIIGRLKQYPDTSSAIASNNRRYQSMSGDMTFKSVKVQSNNVLVVERNPSVATKIGFDGDMLATVQGDTLFTIRRDQEKSSDNIGAVYAVNERLQLYSHPDKSDVPPYIEMEMTSPKKILKSVGDSLTLATIWELKLLPEGKRDPASVAPLLTD
jgi:hypothetical protein